ncbi:uncharacterized protein [Arachis hypogaea]|uniref:uncharacterized protein isoform X2 n=1 Tax=Arachis hypogaea TaxID=3818 RepID=UPI000DEDB105|nr:probable serine/threonine-protein kinase DDB_G0267686 isoform X2 [Arachis hypogaea]QHN96965.1 Serine/threonine-protein kinase [Arachis hypogaea]
MEPSGFQRTLMSNSMEPRNEFHHGSHSVTHDRMDGSNTNRRPPDLNKSEVKPVLNYSIQTGEEFALEFMRDRVNLGKPVFSNVGDSNYTTGYMELQGMLGIGHAGSGSGSDISMLSVVDKYPKEFDKINTSIYGDRSNYGSIRSIPTTSLNQDNRQFVHRYGSSRGYDSSLLMMKFLCSFGGRILPRPSDGKLRYVGGDTRILRIRKDITWQELMHKALLIYSQVQVIKYQLPGEDLDALVSVSSDEDLQNMMEECTHLQDREGTQKLRMFLFSISDLEDAQFGLGSMGDDSEVQYVVAVNGMDLGSRRNSTLIGVGFSADVVHELDGQTIERETNRVAVESEGVSNVPLTNKFDLPLNSQSSQPVLSTAPNSYETYPLFHSDQMMHHEEVRGQYGLNPAYMPVVGETPITMPTTQVVINPQGVLNDIYPPSGLQVQSPEIPTTLMANTSIQQGSDPGKAFSLETPLPAPVQLFDGYPKNNLPEASVAVNVPDGYSLPPTKKDQLQDDEVASSTSRSTFGPTYVDSHSNAVDLSCLHPPPLPKRVYYSERIPREQIELLNRSSKSDDAHGSQFNVSELLSEVNPTELLTESGENLHDGNLSNLTEYSKVVAKPLQSDGITIDNGAVKHQKQLPDASGQLKSKLSEHVKPELKQVLANSEGIIDAVNKDNVPQLESEINSKDNHNKALLGEKKGSKSDLTTLQQVPSVKQLEDPASNLPDIDWGGVSVKDSKDDSVVQGLPVSVNGNATTNGDSQHYPSNVSKEGQGEMGKVEEDNRTQHVTPLTAEEKYQNDLDGRIGTETAVPESNYDHSQLNDAESMQFDAMMENARAQESEFEDALVEARKSVLPPLDPSLGDIDMSGVQVIMNEDLEELKELGSGTFGTVYHGKWRGTDVAIKRIKKSCFTGRSSEQERLTVEFWREADILSKLHHPNVVAFYGVVQDGPGGTMATVTEFMVDGSLRHVLLRKDRYLDRRKRLIIAMDAAFGMEYLHSKNIVHFDLKCDNLLVNLKDPLRPICKVGDFGLSKIKRNTLVSGGVRGTLPWMAPELLNGSSNKVSEKVDVFSFGIVLWEILTGEEPYANMHYGAIIGGIVNNTLRPTIPSYCDNEWRTLMEQCWAPNPAARPSFTEIASRLRVMSAAASQTKTQGHKASK